MNITVLGCGAMGQLWLTMLLKQGHQVQGWLRVQQPTFLTHVQMLNGMVITQEIITNSVEFLQQSDLLLVTLKAWQVSDAVRHLSPFLPTACPILLLHNGMGTTDELRLLPHPLIIGVTTQAAYRKGNAAIHVASGITHIGPATSTASGYSFLADLLHDALPDVAWHDSIIASAWKKLAVNCVINPLTAGYGCSNGELHRYANEVAAITGEVAEVMTREGHHTTHEDLLAWVWQIIDSTSANISSMFQDIRAMRRTEIDYITGFLLRRARARGVAVPENSQLFALIKNKENHYKRIGTGMPSSWN